MTAAYSATAQARRASIFKALHAPGAVPLIVPNAWDALSSALITKAGAAAICTTSAGMSWVLGHQDGSMQSIGGTRVSPAQMSGAVERIVSATPLPVSVDIEEGYGPHLSDVERSVATVISCGAVGINIEDTDAQHTAVLDPSQAAERVAAARATADQALPDMVINARTDTFLIGTKNLDDAIQRSEAYGDAGADCFFVPGLFDLPALRELVAASPVPVNVMLVPGGPSTAQVLETGVRRISVGSALLQIAYSAALKTSRDLLQHQSLTGPDEAISVRELGKMVTPQGR